VNETAAARRSSLRRRRGRLTTLLEALSADSRHESRWARAAEREERARRLETSRACSGRAPGASFSPAHHPGSLELLLAGSGIRLLNDRRVPGARRPWTTSRSAPEGSP
jgi:hypothetical protein